jgi:hypothetical protein
MFCKIAALARKSRSGKQLNLLIYHRLSCFFPQDAEKMSVTNWMKYTGWLQIIGVFFVQCHYMFLMDIVVSAPGCGRSVTDFWGWDAHEEQLRCTDEVDGDIWTWSTRSSLKPKFYWTTQIKVTIEIFPFKEKFPMVEPWIEPGTSWSVVRNSDH